MAVDPLEGFKFILKNLQPEDLKGFSDKEADTIILKTLGAVTDKWTMARKKEGVAYPPFANQFVAAALEERSRFILKANDGLTSAMTTAGADALKSATGTDAEKAKAVYLAMLAQKKEG